MAFLTSEWALAVSRHNLWLYQSTQDIKMRYRRSVLGPWWVTLSTAMVVAVLGILWAEIFNQPVSEYLPYFCIGYVFWHFFATQLSESCSSLAQFESIIKQVRLPYPVYILRVYFRNVIVLAHNIIVLIAVLVFYDKLLLVDLPGLILGLMLFFLFTLGVSSMLAVLCARYRDLTQLVSTLIQLLFFVTPIVWRADSIIGQKRAFLSFNPIYYFFECIRSPLLSSSYIQSNYLIAALLSFVSVLCGYFAVEFTKNKISFWV